MMRISIPVLVLAAALGGATSALAQAAGPTPWELKPDTGYAYDKEGKTFSYKMGTNNAGTLLKGARKVPKGTLFFIGQNGQLYMRTGPYLEGAGNSMSGSKLFNRRLRVYPPPPCGRGWFRANGSARTRRPMINSVRNRVRGFSPKKEPPPPPPPFPSPGTSSPP